MGGRVFGGGGVFVGGRVFVMFMGEMLGAF